MLATILLLVLATMSVPAGAAPIWSETGSAAHWSRRLLSDFDRGGPFWIFIMIPAVAGAVGWLTNVIALRMCFSPLEFKGPRLWQPEGQPFGLFGWQGIIPAKAGKMAGIMTDLITQKLLDIDEVFGRVDPSRVAADCHKGMLKATQVAVDQVAMTHFAGVWTHLDEALKQDVYKVASKDAALFASLLMRELQHHVLDVLNMKHMVVSLAEADKSLVVNMFQEVGAQEFRFIERSGFVFGTLFGLVQALIYYFYKAWWVLPVAGLLVGWLTNVLALKLIFEPAHPVSVCGAFKVQGAFLKRQEEVSVHMAAVTCKSFVRQQDMWEEIMTGDKREAFNDLVRRVTAEFFGAVMPTAGHVGVALLLGHHRYHQIQAQVAASIAAQLPTVVKASFEYMDEVMDIQTDLRTKMAALPPDEFVGVLRPVFSEDEAKLIAVGALLGAAVGAAQVALFSFIV